jgi:DNA-binding winged helix-turn-helix (wHTH) protein
MMKAEQTVANFEEYEFAGFRLDTSKNLLSCDGEPIKLPAKAVELLIFLLKNNGRVVSKEEILEAVWPNSFVEEANLTVHISALRKVLANANGHQNGAEGIRIETFPKVGYRFTGEVKRARDEPSVNGTFAVPETAGTASPSRQDWLRYLAYTLAAVVLLAPVYLGFRWLRPGSSVPVISRLNGFEGVSSFAVSPDGRYAAQVTRRDGKAGIAMVHLGSNSRIQLVEPAEFVFHGLKFSRDGNYLYFTRTSPNEPASLFRTPILSPEPAKLVSNVAIHVGVAPTDDRICFIRQSGKQKTDLIVANIDGTGERVLASREGEETYWSWSIDWSPDGQQIATSVQRTGQNANTRLVTVNVETGEEEPITGPVFGSGGGEGLVWLADGSGIIYSGGDLVETLAQLWHIEYPNGNIRKLTNDVESYGYPSVSQDGQIMAAQFDDTNAIWVDPAPFDSAKPLTSPFKHNLNWVRTNSLGQIVFGSSARGTRDIWLINSDGSGERQLPRTPAATLCRYYLRTVRLSSSRRIGSIRKSTIFGE